MKTDLWCYNYVVRNGALAFGQDSSWLRSLADYAADENFSFLVDQASMLAYVGYDDYSSFMPAETDSSNTYVLKADEDGWFDVTTFAIGQAEGTVVGFTEIENPSMNVPIVTKAKFAFNYPGIGLSYNMFSQVASYLFKFSPTVSDTMRCYDWGAGSFSTSCEIWKTKCSDLDSIGFWNLDFMF